MRNEDGSYTATISSGPVNYRDESGSWLPISNDLVDAPGAAYAVENEANDYTVSIPENPAVTPVKFELAGNWVTMKLVGSRDVDADVSGAEASFEDLTPAADEVAYQALERGVKETITLDAAPTTPVSYAYNLKVDADITPVLTPTGTVEFRDAQGTPQFVIPVGSMTDSATPKAASSDAVDYDLQPIDGGWRFTITPGQAWLAEPARVYPVAIDPTVEKITQKDCWLEQESPNATHCGEQFVKAGVNVNNKKRRGLFDFNLDNIPHDAIINNGSALIWVDMYSTGGAGITTNYALYSPGKVWSSVATWANAKSGEPWDGGGSGAQLSQDYPISGQASGWLSFNITGGVQAWIKKPSDPGWAENRGVLLRQNSENVKTVLGFVSSTYPNTGLRPKLYVDYTDNPPTVSGVTVSPPYGNATTTSTTPTFSASVNDPEGANVAACFWVYNATLTTNLWVGCGPWVNNNHVSSVAMPAGYLSLGQQYVVIAYGSDGLNWSSNSSSATFLTATDPVVQQIVALSSPGTTQTQVVTLINDVIANHATQGDSVPFSYAEQEVLSFLQADSGQLASGSRPTVQNSCAWSVQTSASSTTASHGGVTGNLTRDANSDDASPVYTGVVDGSNVTLTVFEGAPSSQLSAILASGEAQTDTLAQSSLIGATDNEQPDVNQTFSNMPAPSALVPVGYRLEVGVSALERGLAVDSGNGVTTGGSGAPADCLHSDTSTADAELNTADGQMSIPSSSAASSSPVVYPATTTAFRYRTFIPYASATTGPICGEFEGDNRGFSSYYSEPNRTRASAFFNWPIATIDTTKHVGQTHRYSGTYVISGVPPLVVHFSDKKKTASSDGIVFHNAYMKKNSAGQGTYGEIGIIHAVKNPLCGVAGPIKYNITVESWPSGAVRVTGWRGKVPNHEAYAYPHSEANGEKLVQGAISSPATFLCLNIRCGTVSVDEDNFDYVP